MARVGTFSPDLLALSWFDDDATANGWFSDDLIEADEETPPEPEPEAGGLTRRIMQLRRGR